MYILKCSDNSYYKGSTTNLELRLQQHQNGEGANHTKKHLPVELVYYEEYERIDEAFYREKQVQGWTRKKKEALMGNKHDQLHLLSTCNNETHYSHFEKENNTEVVSATLNHQISTTLNHQTSATLNHQEGGNTDLLKLPNTD